MVAVTVNCDCAPATEDFSDISTALGVSYAHWGLGGIDHGIHRTAEQAGRVSKDIPSITQPGIPIRHTLLGATSPSSTANPSPLR